MLDVSASFHGTQMPYVPAPFVRHDRDLRVPEVGRFAVLLHDWRLAEYDYKPRQVSPGYGQRVAVPSTRQFFKKPDFIPLPDAWAWRWLDVLQWAANGLLSAHELKAVWRRLISNRVAFTDNHAPENGYRDPITNENPDAENISLATLGTTGNLVKIVGADSGEYRVIETFDLSQPPPTLREILAQPWKWYWATEQTLNELPRGADGSRRWTVSNFPHLESALGRVCGLPMPYVSVGGFQWVRIEHIERIGNGAMYSPYVPEV